MAKIIRVNQILSLAKNLRKSCKTTVLAGGCFDVLHPGHIIFLEKAKQARLDSHQARQAGNILIVLLESDQKIKFLKGINRPVHSQVDRAQVLSALQSVDCIVLLPFMETDLAYETLVRQIKPDIIAVTKGEEHQHQKRAAELTGAELKFVTKKIGNYSTSRILNN